MEIIETKIDRESADFKENFAAMEKLVTRLNEELRIAREARSEKAMSRLREQNKLSVRERLAMLFDRNTPVLEIAPLAAYDMYDKGVHGAGSVAAIGVVHGREVLVVASDPTIKGGTIYPLGVKKSLRCQTIVMENNLPLINL